MAPEADLPRQALIIMFLSLPVYQDPAPWNVVWRAGELFPIDVGDGLTMEQRQVGLCPPFLRTSAHALVTIASHEPDGA